MSEHELTLRALKLILRLMQSPHGGSILEIADMRDALSRRIREMAQRRT